MVEKSKDVVKFQQRNIINNNCNCLLSLLAVVLQYSIVGELPHLTFLNPVTFLVGYLLSWGLDPQGLQL